MCLCTQGGRRKKWFPFDVSPDGRAARFNRYPNFRLILSNHQHLLSAPSTFTSPTIGEQKEEAGCVLSLSHTQTTRAAHTASSFSLRLRLIYYLQRLCYYFTSGCLESGFNFQRLVQELIARVQLLHAGSTRDSSQRFHIFPNFDSRICLYERRVVHEFVSEWGVRINGQ